MYIFLGIFPKVLTMQRLGMALIMVDMICLTGIACTMYEIPYYKGLLITD